MEVKKMPEGNADKPDDYDDSVEEPAEVP